MEPAGGAVHQRPHVPAVGVGVEHAVVARAAGGRRTGVVRVWVCLRPPARIRFRAEGSRGRWRHLTPSLPVRKPGPLRTDCGPSLFRDGLIVTALGPNRTHLTLISWVWGRDLIPDSVPVRVMCDMGGELFTEPAPRRIMGAGQGPPFLVPGIRD